MDGSMKSGRDGEWGLLARLVDVFLRGGTAPALIVVSLLAGLFAILATPREEEPQIVVPMADVFVRAPGLSAEAVERQVATPVEKLLHQIEGVKHVYSVSMPGRAVATVRFRVGEDREDSLVKIYNKLYSNTDRVPADVTGWVVKPVEIDDVPIVIVTLWSDRPDAVNDFALRRIAEEVEIELQALPDTNRTTVVGGRPRVIRVELNNGALAARRTSALEVAWALGVSNVRRRAGGFDRDDRHLDVDAGDFFGGVPALRRAVVNVVDGVPVFLSDVARIVDGPEERTGYSWIGFGPANGETAKPTLYPAVHIAVAKQKGTNAVDVAMRVRERVAALAQTHFPVGVHARITRDYGETANGKVNELLEALAVAVLIVIGLIAYSLGWREGLVVAVAVPVTFALALLINYWAGYTINRVTLFALILSLGLVVDDPIVGIENIYRHLRRHRLPPREAIREAVNEVLPPILFATLAVIVSFLPMTLITGMMGPYMRPMALNVPVAMAVSMFVSITITPWLAYHALRKHAARGAESDDSARGVEPEDPSGESPRLHRLYTTVLEPLLDDRRKAWAFLGVMIALFIAAAALGVLRMVPLKMLPFDNRNELQIVVNAPEGTTLERTDAILRRLAAILRAAPEVRDYETYAGIPAPMDFNGMVRHYYLREAPNTGEIRINLVEKRKREMQSHEIALRLRNKLEAVAWAEGARIAIVESPPGPPVLATITAEVYGEPGVSYDRIRAAARELERRLMREPGAGDVDSTVEDDAPRLLFVTDREKAALSGIAADDVARTVSLALSGLDVGRLQSPGEVNPLPIRLRLARKDRSGATALRALVVKGRPGIAKIRDRGGVRDASVPMVRLGELGKFDKRPAEKAIYRKDLKRVVFVYAEAVGRAPAAIAADVAADLRPGGDVSETATLAPRPLETRTYLSNGGGLHWRMPPGTHVEWLGEGELNITRDVFRDLGIAFAVALVGIYLIVLYQTRSYAMPLVLMISIPLTLIGIAPGFWLLNLVTGTPVSGYANPIFFTATAMIGMIALSGIVVRNSILLIEFLHTGLARGTPLREAILAAGAVRTRPILLTAGTAMLAAVPITLDPVFSGLAWALIFGLFVSTAFTLLIVPVVYDLVYRRHPGHGLPAPTGRRSHDAIA